MFNQGFAPNLRPPTPIFSRTLRRPISSELHETPPTLRGHSLASSRDEMPRPNDDLHKLIKAVRELQLKLTREIDRSRRLSEVLGQSEDKLRADGERMASLLER